MSNHDNIAKEFTRLRNLSPEAWERELADDIQKTFKKKYWYVTDIESCVLCGREKKSRYRVYEKPKFSVNWIEDACQTHFI